MFWAQGPVSAVTVHVGTGPDLAGFPTYRDLTAKDQLCRDLGAVSSWANSLYPGHGKRTMREAEIHLGNSC
jgi:hypothetical protein